MSSNKKKKPEQPIFDSIRKRLLRQVKNSAKTNPEKKRARRSAKQNIKRRKTVQIKYGIFQKFLS